MHRLGAILMILGINVIVVSIVAAYWRASFECALQAADGACAAGVFGLFMALLFSAKGLVYWAAILVGLWVFWRGRKMRAD